MALRVDASGANFVTGFGGQQLRIDSAAESVGNSVWELLQVRWDGRLLAVKQTCLSGVFSLGLLMS